MGEMAERLPDDWPCLRPRGFWPSQKGANKRGEAEGKGRAPQAREREGGEGGKGEGADPIEAMREGEGNGLAGR